MWENQLGDVAEIRKEYEGKVPIIDLKRTDRIVTAGGSVAEITGHRTKENVQIRLIETGVLTWVSRIASVHLAR